MGADPLVEPGRVLLGRLFRSLPKPKVATTNSQAVVAVSSPLGDSIFAGDRHGHLITFAPPNTDRARAVIIPNLLCYPGSTVVMDPTGELYKDTATARRAMGQTVVRLDPFYMVEPTTDAFNPLDLIPTSGPELESMCRVIVDLFFPPTFVHDRWRQAAASLLLGVLGYIQSVPEKRTMAELSNVFTGGDVVYNLAVVLDTIGKQIPKWSYDSISAFLQMADIDRSRILSEVILRTQPLTSSVEVLRVLDERMNETPEQKKVRLANGEEPKQRTQSLAVAESILAGRPFTLYFVIPLTRLPHQALLLRLWIGLLLRRLMNLPRPENLPLFLLDHTAHLEYFQPLEAAVAHGLNGMRVWTFWDDICQLRGTYPGGWSRILRGCRAVQVFGSCDYLYAAESAAILGISAEEVLQLSDDEQLVRTKDGVLKLKKLDPSTEL